MGWSGGRPSSLRMALKRRTLSVITSTSSPATNIWPRAVLGGHAGGGLGGEGDLDVLGQFALVAGLGADGCGRDVVDLALELEALGAVGRS